MKIQKINIQKLKPAIYNPRKNLKPEDEEYQKIKNSILEYGCVMPLVVNKDMTIIGGHQRLKVLKNVGFQVRENLIWVKNKFILGRSDYHWRHEPCLYGWKDGKAHYKKFKS